MITSALWNVQIWWNSNCWVLLFTLQSSFHKSINSTSSIKRRKKICNLSIKFDLFWYIFDKKNYLHCQAIKERTLGCSCGPSQKAFNPMPCIKGLKTCELALRSSLTNPAFPGLGTCGLIWLLINGLDCNWVQSSLNLLPICWQISLVALAPFVDHFIYLPNVKT